MQLHILIAEYRILIEARRWVKERSGMSEVTSGGMREEIEL
jgi:hypothetical protein